VETDDGKDNEQEKKNTDMIMANINQDINYGNTTEQISLCKSKSH
jgi:hypothetical protein